MRRIMILATFITFALTSAGFSSPILQTPTATTTLRRIQVNGRSIQALPTGTNYVVDLTQRGVKYEFDPQAGQIDFNRVRVRTARGEVAISSFLEKTFPKEQLSRFKLGSQAFILGTSRLSGTLQNPSARTSNFGCSAEFCSCEGRNDCIDLIFIAGLCGGQILCFKESSANPIYECVCSRKF